MPGVGFPLPNVSNILDVGIPANSAIKFERRAKDGEVVSSRNVARAYAGLLAALALASTVKLTAVEPAYPLSPVIQAIEWAPAATIVRQAKDGDNWPVTWGADD